MIGQVFSHYRVIDQIGAGGMGVVYRAEDIRLGRTLVLKFLPAALSRDPMALERFEREAKAASSMNHPGICTVYDIGEFEGQRYIAMEYLEGQPLDRFIGGKPLPLPTMLDLGVQITDAHRAGAHAGHPAPRHQAGQHLHHQARARQGARLRAGQAGRRRLGRDGVGRNGPDRGGADPDHGRDGGGHRRLHVARTGAGRGAGHAVGLVLAGRRPARDGDRTPGVCRPDRRGGV